MEGMHIISWTKSPYKANYMYDSDDNEATLMIQK